MYFYATAQKGYVFRMYVCMYLFITLKSIVFKFFSVVGETWAKQNSCVIT